MKIDFVKAHAGWDEIVFIYGNQVPAGKELEVGLSLLKRPSLRGTEVGILYDPEQGGDIKVRIVDATSNDFISMCGGLTQALGKAVVETDIGRRYKIKIREPVTELLLETEAGLVPIKVDVSNGMARKITTNMQSYVKECYRHGVRGVKVGNINAVGVGFSPPKMEFLVLNVDKLEKKYPEVNFWGKNRFELDVLRELYEDFIREESLEESFLYGALYDMHPEDDGDARVIFRFLPTMYYQEKDYEEACGTGTAAVGIAMVERGDLDIDDGTPEILFEVGRKSIVGKLQQVETRLKMRINNDKVVDAEFSHSLVEIIAYGEVDTLTGM